MKEYRGKSKRKNVKKEITHLAYDVLKRNINHLTTNMGST